MKAKEFDKLASYEYYILKDVDDRGELIRIRFVGETSDTTKLLKDNGYVVTFVGVNAIQYDLPNYRAIVVKKETSSEGKAGTIAATDTMEVFDKDGNCIGSVWDTRKSSIGGMSYHLVDTGHEYLHGLRVVHLEDKYVEYFKRLRDERHKKGFLTEMTYQQLWEMVDNKKED